jgi:hypothetical protein
MLEVLLRAKSEGLQTFQQAESGLMGMAKAAALVSVVVGVAAVAALGEAAKMAAQFQSAQALLNNALKDAGEKVTPQMSTALEALEAKMRVFGDTDTQTLAVMTQLTEGGLTWTQAMSAMGPIADLAAAKHLDLATSAKDVLLGMQGSGRALKELGITLPATIPSATALANAITAVGKAEEKVATTHGPAHVAALKVLEAAQAKVALITTEQSNRTAGLSQILDALSGKLGGSASVASQTLGGHMSALRAELDHAAVQIGTVLIPYVDQFLAAVAPIVPVIADWATQMVTNLMPQIVSFAGWLKTLGPDLKTAWNLLSTLAPYIVAIGAAWVLWNVALAITNAIGMAVMIGRLVVAIAIAIPQVGFLRSAMLLLDLAMDANPIGLITIAVAALVVGVIWAYKNVGWFRDAVNGAWSDLQRFGGWLQTTLTPILNNIGGFFDRLGTSANVISQALSVFGGGSGNGSAVPAGAHRSGVIGAATGFEGTVYKPTLFLAGEGGSPERVSIGPQRGGAGGGDASETNSLLRQLIAAVTAVPGGQTGTEAHLYKAFTAAGLNRMRGGAGA